MSLWVIATVKTARFCFLLSVMWISPMGGDHRGKAVTPWKETQWNFAKKEPPKQLYWSLEWEWPSIYASVELCGEFFINKSLILLNFPKQKNVYINKHIQVKLILEFLTGHSKIYVLPSGTPRPSSAHVDTLRSQCQWRSRRPLLYFIHKYCRILSR